MEATWDIDDVARTSDDAAVRRRFDQRNLVWLVVLLVFFAFVSFFEVLTEQHSNLPLDVLVGTSNLAFVSLMLLALWSKRTRPWLTQRVAALVILFVAVQYTLLMVFTGRTDNWVAWATTFPMMMLGFRMLVSELVLIHALLTAGGVLMSFVAPTPGGDHDKFYIAVLGLNAVMIGIELYMSRRMRRQVVAEWTQRRAQARDQIRMRDELQYARELQLSMLPECAPALGWIDICATSIPATEVGGDYYDYFVGDDHVALVSGDVAGHGMSAGLVLAAVRAGFTILRASLDDPAAVLRRLHDLVAETSRRRMLVTLSVALVHRDQKRVTIASAGHPPVLIRRADGTVETIDLFAAPLGVRLPVNIPHRQLPIASGDALILHSDGIYETRNAAGDVYGLDRLADAASRANGTASSILDTILGDVTAFRGDADMEDDVTLVVAKLA